MLEETTLARHLDALGWEARPHGDRTFRCAHESDEGEVTVYIRLTDNWLIASVVPFLSTRGKNPFELSRWLLRQNRDMFQAKFAYDEDGDVVLTVELPTESLDFSEIKEALSGLLRHAVNHRNTLRAAAEAARRG
ncbi:MAG: YbjN domain-containing protein [Myxococcota bacterium]